MPKLTEKTIKEGQKCVLTTKTPLFHDYKHVGLPWEEDTRERMISKLPELLALPNIVYIHYDEKYIRTGVNDNHFISGDGLDPKRIVKEYGSPKYYSDDITGVITSHEFKGVDGNTIYSHIGPTKLKEMKKDAKMSKYISGNGEVKPIITLDKGTEIEVHKLAHRSKGSFKDSNEYMNVEWDTQVALKVISGPHKGSIFTSAIKAIKSRLDTAHFEDLSAETNAKPKYKIFYKGEPYRIDTYDYDNDNKPKKGASKIYGDLGKVKASLMGRFGYLDKVYQLNKHFQDLSPEVGYSAPDWIGGSADFNRNDVKEIQVFEWTNRKKGKEADFDALAYYDSLMDFVKVTAQYGSAVRDQYKKYKDTKDFTTILCFMHEDYRTDSGDYYEDLKESQIIKDVMKLSKVKGTKKCTKNGKTAICFKNESDAMQVIKNLEKDTYFVLDMNGTQLVEQSAHFIQSVARTKKLERILKDEFENDFDL